MTLNPGGNIRDECSRSLSKKVLSEPRGRDQGRQHVRKLAKTQSETLSASEGFAEFMLLTVTQLSREQPIDSWFCLRAHPKREHIAAACLRHLPGVDVFCPRVRFRKPTRRGLVWFVESMFPGYLFARFDYPILHRRIRQIPGVGGFVQFGDRLALLPDRLITEISDHTDVDEIMELNSNSLEPGQQVRITQGPFEGLEALVTRLISARQRVEILVEWMGRSLRAEAAIAGLLPLTDLRA
jgi:transcriptional antiterminator RfaH